MTVILYLVSRKAHEPSPGINGSCTIFIAAAVTSIWYVPKIDVIHQLARGVSPTTLSQYGFTSVFSLKALTFYLSGVLTELYLLYFLIFIAVLLYLLFRYLIVPKKKHEHIAKTKKALTKSQITPQINLRILILWFIVGGV